MVSATRGEQTQDNCKRTPDSPVPQRVKHKPADSSTVRRGRHSILHRETAATLVEIGSVENRRRALGRVAQGETRARFPLATSATPPRLDRLIVAVAFRPTSTLTFGQLVRGSKVPAVKKNNVYHTPYAFGFTIRADVFTACLRRPGSALCHNACAFRRRARLPAAGPAHSVRQLLPLPRSRQGQPHGRSQARHPRGCFR